MPEAPPCVCILAGGRGTRLGSLAEDVPKPLLTVAGQPFLCHQLRLLAHHGVRDAVICVGHMGEQVEAAIGDACHGVRVAYSRDGPGLDGTLGAIRRALPLLPERFLVLYGDTYPRVDFETAAHAWRASGLAALMVVLHNQGRWDTSNVVYRDGRVLAYDKHSPTARMDWIDYGVGGLEVDALALVSEAESDLSALYSELARRGQLFGFGVAQRFYEIGTPPALAETEAFLAGLLSARP